jgi:archaeal flagellar protein FlaJ
LFLEVIFLMLLVIRVPNDDLWTTLSERLGLRKEMDTYLPLTLALCGLVGIMAWRFLEPDLPFLIAIAVTPLGVLGYAVARYETAIRRKDDNFPAFIRSLGASTSARGGSPKDVLKRLRRHDFGPLTRDVEALYRRLNLRLDDEGSWKRFANETSSNIIEKFTAMFIEGINAGGEADEIGLIVSDNVVRIIALRKHREQTAASFRGMIMGLTAGMAASLYIGVGLLETLTGIFTRSTVDAGETAGAIGIEIGAVDIPLMAMLVTGIMALHILIASYMQTTAAGGSLYRMAAYVPLLAWLNAGAAWITLRALDAAVI